MMQEGQTTKPRKRLSDYNAAELQARQARMRARHQHRLIQAETIPTTGKVRAAQFAAFFSIGISTLWLYVSQGRVKPPQKYGSRVSVWDAEYVHQLYRDGIPAAQVVEG